MQLIVPSAADQEVRADPSAEDVVPAGPAQHVVTPAGQDHVGSRSPHESIGLRRPDDGGDPPAASRRRAGRGRRQELSGRRGRRGTPWWQAVANRSWQLAASQRDGPSRRSSHPFTSSFGYRAIEPCAFGLRHPNRGRGDSEASDHEPQDGGVRSGPHLPEVPRREPDRPQSRAAASTGHTNAEIEVICDPSTSYRVTCLGSRLRITTGHDPGRQRRRVTAPDSPDSFPQAPDVGDHEQPTAVLPQHGGADLDPLQKGGRPSGSTSSCCSSTVHSRARRTRRGPAATGCAASRPTRAGREPTRTPVQDVLGRGAVPVDDAALELAHLMVKIRSAHDAILDRDAALCKDLVGGSGDPVVD